MSKSIGWQIIIKTGLVLFIGVIGLIPLSGCDDDDDENLIQICNYDNEEYVVKLHRDSDGVIIADLHVEEWYDTDKCDDFHDLPENRYYLTIHEDNAVKADSTSKSFYLDDDDEEYFRIDSTGTIKD